MGNLAACSGQELARTPAGDTLAYLCERLSPAALSELRAQMARDLIRSRALDGQRIYGRRWAIALDGTGHLGFSRPHCPHCLEATSGGRTRFYHNTLEAKLITPSGLALSVGTEFIENGSPGATKQDCELAAFYRLAPRLQRDFPQLPLVLVADSLYACAPVFEICRSYGWRYIFTLKEGRIPTLFSEFEQLKGLDGKNTMRVKGEEAVQEFRWVGDLEHAGHRLAVLQCVETKKRTGQTTRFVWVTNIEVNRSNYLSVAKGGRLRWTIENQGFNTQKNGGYGLEHAFCSDNNAAKNFYLLLQIAHMINQLMEKGSLLRSALKTFGSIRNLARFLLEAFRTCLVGPDYLEAELAVGYQIRLGPL